MKIQHKIIWITCLLFGFMFLISAVIIYSSFVSSSKNIFYEDLSRTARISGMFYLEKDELNASNYIPIQNEFYKLNPERKISIYDRNRTTVFNTKEQTHVDAAIINKIKSSNVYNFSREDTYYHGLFYKDNQGDFVVIVSSRNKLIEEQKESLIGILAIVFCTGMLVLILLTSRMARYAYKPVRTIIKQVKNLDLNQNQLSLTYPKTRDELEELFEAFNALLNEIKHSYQQQKNFVNNASHELKTPLASIINELEVSLQRPRATSEYEASAEAVLNSANRLEQILENLLLLSGIQRKVHDKRMLRVDELIWEVIEALSPKYGNRFQVQINITPALSHLLSKKLNESLVYMALFNLIENAAKFSKKEVWITLSEQQQRLTLSIEDFGIGIASKDLQFMEQPFYRGTNADKTIGNGLGFSIASMILRAHHIPFDLNSAPGQGTKISLHFP